MSVFPKNINVTKIKYNDMKMRQQLLLCVLYVAEKCQFDECERDLRNRKAITFRICSEH